MEMRTIGQLSVSVVGLGTNNFGLRMHEDEVAPVVDAAFDAGINFFDTADSYGTSEQRLGRALGKRRDEVVIASKFGSRLGDEPAGASPAYVRSAIDRSLRELGTDRIDLYQLHVPDPDTPIADTLSALDELVKAGKVLEIGCSNFSVEQLREAEEAVGDGGTRFISVQNHYNLLVRGDEAEVIPECEREGVAYLPFFPLASGLLTGKYTRGEPPPQGTRLQKWGDRAKGVMTDDNFDSVDALTSWANERGHSVLELAIAWLAARPVVASVIAGATKPEQVAANAKADGWRLTSEEVAEVDSLTPSPRDASRS
jgi:aryl-alcohol dehydrogenase-like predicted oxidoreductase